MPTSLSLDLVDKKTKQKENSELNQTFEQALNRYLNSVPPNNKIYIFLCSTRDVLHRLHVAHKECLSKCKKKNQNYPMHISRS